MSGFTIGKLAKSASVGVETVRFYERVGLIDRPGKGARGFRCYKEEDTQRIRFIKRAQELGYTLREIMELIELSAKRRVTCADYVGRIESKLAEIDRKIEDLKRIRQSLGDILALCDDDSCPADCEPLNCFENGCEPAILNGKEVSS